MTDILKQPLIVSCAGAITLLLFLFVHLMVTKTPQPVSRIGDINLVDFIRMELPPPPPPEKQRERIKKIEEPPPPEKIPPVPRLATRMPPPPQIKMELPPPEIRLPSSIPAVPYTGEYVEVPPAPPPPPSPPQETPVVVETPAVIETPVVAETPVVTEEPDTRETPTVVATEPSPARSEKPAATSRPEIITDISPKVRIEPQYPSRALRAGIEGSVTVEFTITVDGSVRDIEIVRADPPKLFDNEVLKALKRWKFAPQTIDGKAVERRARQTIRFTMRK